MPIIQFKKADLLHNLTMQAGIYPAVMCELDGPKASKSGKGNNYFAKFRLGKGDYEGKELMALFSTAVNNTITQNGMVTFPVAAFAEIDAAIKSSDIPIGDGQIDTDELLNKPLCIKVGVHPDQNGGRLVNTISEFLPPGSDETVASPF